MFTLTAAALALTMQAAPAACSPGWIVGTRDDKRIWASRAPSPGARKVAKLKAGAAVLVCGQKREWVFIRFADGGHSCGGLDGRTPRADSTCAEGWIERRRVGIRAR